MVEQVDLTAMTALNRYKFLTATVVPRPIALVSTLNRDKTLNVAPFSQFIILSATPPILGIVSGRHPDGLKDTHRNILETNDFVINTVSEEMALTVQQCAIPFRRDISEANVLGLKTRSTMCVNGRALVDAPFAFECKLTRTEMFGETATLIAGEVVAVSACCGLVSGHRVSHDKLKPLGRIAGRNYCRTNSKVTVSPDIDDDFSDLARIPTNGEFLP